MNKTEFLKAINKIIPPLEEPHQFIVEDFDDDIKKVSVYARQQGRNQERRASLKRGREYADNYDWDK
jgi:hypothetical protein